LNGQSIDSAFLPDLDQRLAALFAPATFPDVASVQLKWTEVEKDQVEFVNRLTDESLQQMLPFRTAQARLVYLMQHVANHSTYHRGQIALMLRQLGAEPVPTNFHEFLLEPRRGPLARTLEPKPEGKPSPFHGLMENPNSIQELHESDGTELM
jgi:hypothetical protein